MNKIRKWFRKIKLKKIEKRVESVCYLSDPPFSYLHEDFVFIHLNKYERNEISRLKNKNTIEYKLKEFNPKKEKWYEILKESQNEILIIFYNLMETLNNDELPFSIYNELSVQNSKEPIEDFTKTKTYLKYLEIKHIVKNLYCNNIIYEYERYFCENYKNCNNNCFMNKEVFLDICTYYLSKFYRKMISAAELYIQDKQQN